MKALLSFVSVVLFTGLLIFNVGAAGPVDGYQWKKFRILEKDSYIRGYFDADRRAREILDAMQVGIPQVPDSKLRQYFQKVFRLVVTSVQHKLPPRTRMEDFIREIDRVYGDRGMTRVEVSKAMHLAELNLSGAPLKDIQFFRRLILSSKKISKDFLDRCFKALLDGSVKHSADCK